MVTVFRTIWGGSDVVGGGVGTLCFQDGQPSALDDVAGVIDTMLAQVAAQVMTIGGTVRLEPEVRRFAAATGELQEISPIQVASTHLGTREGNAVPRASQVLVRFRTASIRSNRVVQGRYNIPSCSLGLLNSGGQLSSPARSLIQGIFDTMQASLNDTLEVWSKPKPGRPGTESLVTSVDVWEELAVLTSRRD